MTAPPPPRSAWSRCAERAEAAADPLEGSAPPADHWFLIEHPGPWEKYILPGQRLDRGTANALSAWSRANTGRVLMVRRPGRAGRMAEHRRWFRVDSRPGHEAVRTGLFCDERELVELLDDPAAGEPHAGSLQLVCAHGKHDPCCAVRGRQLAAALDQSHRAGTWETSHIGGCRFSPALVLLPHGVILGHVPPAAAAALVEDYRRGVLDPRWVRGRSSYTPVVQAAQHHARLATGANAVDALRPVRTRQQEPGQWHVAFADPDCAVVLRERRVDVDRPLTCAAAASGWMRVFDLVALETGVVAGS